MNAKCSTGPGTAWAIIENTMRVAVVLLFATIALAQKSDQDHLLQQAAQEQQRGEYSAAIRDYREVLKMRPNLAAAKVNLGAALSDTGHYDDAITEFFSALPSLSDKKPVLMNIALAYYRKGDLNHARTYLRKARELDPTDQQVTTLLANIDLASGQSEEAVALLEPLSSSNSQNMDFQYLYGAALIASGHPDEGVPRVEVAAEKTNRADAYALAGSTLLKYNHTDSARRDLETALRLNPNLPGIYTLVGVARDKSEDTVAAEQALRKALSIDPNDFQANLTLGAIFYKRRLLPEAKVYLDKALQLKPNDPTAIYQSGMLKAASGDYQEAAEQLGTLSKQYPTWLDPHVALATLYYKIGKPQDGARERALVQELTAEQQAHGPVSR